MMPEPKICARMQMPHDGDINRDVSNVIMKDSPIVAQASAEN